MYVFWKKKATTIPDWKYYPVPYTLHLPPKPRAEPWRYHSITLSNKIYLLPVAFCETFADLKEVDHNRKMEANKIEWLRESIDEEGLKRPCILVIDATGKLRYHDGYHRLAAVQQVKDFSHIPCILQTSTGRIRGYGRPLHQEVEIILEMLSADTET